jgi:hypothetical protein
MISHKHKFIFLFQHKCASSTLRSALEKIDDFNLSFHWGVKSKEYKNDELKKYSDYFVFANIRNPFERAVSAWIYLQKSFPFERQFTKGLSLKKTFTNLPQANDKLYTELDGRSNHDYRHITQEQVDTLLNKEGKFITDMLIRFENLQEDFNTVCDKIGIPQQQLPHENKTKHKHYTEYYDDETKQIVAEKYAKDIEYFGYEFGE